MDLLCTEQVILSDCDLLLNGTSNNNNNDNINSNSTYNRSTNISVTGTGISEAFDIDKSNCFKTTTSSSPSSNLSLDAGSSTSSGVGTSSTLLSSISPSSSSSSTTLTESNGKLTSTSIENHQSISNNNNNNINNNNNNSSSNNSNSNSSTTGNHNNNNNNINNGYRIINRYIPFTNSAIADQTFLTDRCLENLLKTEEKYTINSSYFRTVQKDITPAMRRMVVEWMMEVCEEEKCQEEVVLLALNYMDRFLATTAVKKTHLQILAAACLLLASKLREPDRRGLSAELLVFYTDNAIYKQDLIHWELYVLSRLEWDLSSVTPLDFVELLLTRLPIRNSKCPDFSIDKVRQHAQGFICLSAKDHYFSQYTASAIAASSIAAALTGLNWHLRTGIELRYLLNRLTDLTGVEQDYLHDCMMKMEDIFEEHTRCLQSNDIKSC